MTANIPNSPGDPGDEDEQDDEEVPSSGNSDRLIWITSKVEGRGQPTHQALVHKLQQLSDWGCMIHQILTVPPVSGLHLANGSQQGEQTYLIVAAAPEPVIIALQNKKQETIN